MAMTHRPLALLTACGIGFWMADTNVNNINQTPATLEAALESGEISQTEYHAEVREHNYVVPSREERIKQGAARQRTLAAIYGAFGLAGLLTRRKRELPPYRPQY